MSNKDMQRLIDLAKNTLKKGVTKEEAMDRLVSAGILDKDGNYTKHYPNLARFSKSK